VADPLCLPIPLNIDIIEHQTFLENTEFMDNNPISGSNPENNQNDSQNNMASLLEQEGLDIDFPKAGEIKQGVIASITNTPGQILVGIGGKSEGVISGREFDLIPPEDLAELKVGQEIPVYVISHDEGNANTVLSYMRAREEVGWQEAEELLNSRNPIHSSIIGYNKGGLIVPVAGLRGFVPASQISLTRRASVSGDTPEQRWGKMISQEIDVCLIEIDRERHRLILSERAASTETHDSVKSRVIDELVEGDAYNGRVTSLADFGAFVNINGADGLVHLSEISWEHIQHPGETLKVGQEVKVKVISIDREKKRIGLSIRQLQHDPWSEKAARYNVGQLVEGTITQLTKFGAFARLDDDIEGLIHISEISEKRIEHPREVLHEGDTLTLRVIKIDPANHRIGLSLRKVESMAYADMDWQTLNESLQEDAVIVAVPEEPESTISVTEVPAPEPTEPEVAAPDSTEPVSAETDPLEPKASEPESAASEKE
jgi:small subunit ribosomal protein S1